MQIAVLIEPVAGNGYRAEPLALRGEGATREEALAKLQEQLQQRLGKGATVVSLDVPPPSHPQHPLAKFAGVFKDDPDFQEVKEIIAENRRQMDADPDIP